MAFRLLSSVLRCNQCLYISRNKLRVFHHLPSRLLNTLSKSTSVKSVPLNQGWLHSVRYWLRNNYTYSFVLLTGLGLAGGLVTLNKPGKIKCENEIKPPLPSELGPVADNVLALDKELTLLQKLKLTLRFAYLCLLFSPALVLFSLAYLTGSDLLEKLEVNYLLIVLQSVGPAFIKLGQWAGTRRDIFSKKFCETLSQLHTHCEPHSWDDTTKLLAESFGEDWDKSIEITNQTPIGSGCVAQVYQGHLRHALSPNDSENIAVKVLHPGIVEAMELDIRLMTYVASWVDYVYPDVHWIALRECVDEFAFTMQKQLNLETEAVNLSRFELLMREYKNVKFPTPYYPFVTKTVLVESFERGDHISMFLDQPGGQLQKTLAKIGIEALLDMMFVHNFIHGDLHPGNILVQDPLTDSPKLVLVDCGIATSLGPGLFQDLYSAFSAIVKGDGALLADLFLRDCSCPTLPKYRQDMAELVDDQINHLNLTECQVSVLFSRLFNILIEHKVRIDPHFTSVMTAFMVIEGVARCLDPTMDIMVYAKPCILHRAKLAIREQLNPTTKRKWLFG